jgi:hypothetical protein
MCYGSDELDASLLMMPVTGTYDLIKASSASKARWRGRARPCSHSWSVRVDIRSFKAASLCEKSFFFRHS